MAAIIGSAKPIRLAGAFEVAPDAARGYGGRLAKFQHLFAADMGKQSGDLLGPLHLLKSLDHLHDGDDGKGEPAMRLAVRAGMSGDGGVNASEDFRVDVRVE